MKTLSTLAGIVSIFIHLPIWYYLFYKILESVNASELMWFLFWIYIPVGFFVAIVTKLVTKE